MQIPKKKSLVEFVSKSDLFCDQSPPPPEIDEDDEAREMVARWEESDQIFLVTKLTESAVTRSGHKIN